jgi:hypothetical protein
MGDTNGCCQDEVVLYASLQRLDHWGGAAMLLFVEVALIMRDQREEAVEPESHHFENAVHLDVHN